MLDGWEMQVKSQKKTPTLTAFGWPHPHGQRPGCVPSQNSDCTMEAGGYVWQNNLGGFIIEPMFEVSEMNLTGFAMPENPFCDCNGRWALDPSLDSLKDDTYDIDNDSLG